MTTTTSCSAESRGWPLERVLFAMAGTMTLLSALLAATVSPWFLLLTAFVGINQWLYVAFGLLLVPVILRLLGLWAWWLPRPLRRILPDVRFGHA
ncbi:MAG: DUF2892 domain-containing protein [Candidatus Limnocylindrales bacterium]